MSAALVMDELYARLDESRAAGGMMEGWLFDSQPTERVEGQADKTSLMIGMPETSQVQVGSNLENVTVQVKFWLSSARLALREEADAVRSALTNHLRDIEALKNAVALNTADPRGSDVLFGGLLIEPALWEQNGVTEVRTNSFNTGLTLTLRLPVQQRGEQ